MDVAHPLARFVFPPSDPSKREVGKDFEVRVALQHPIEPFSNAVLRVVRRPAEELPRTVVRVMRHDQHRVVQLSNTPCREDNRFVAIEWHRWSIFLAGARAAAHCACPKIPLDSSWSREARP